ncbi:MAG: 50S ribosomal protein L18 [Flavobacteriales bacterium]|nr:50S ribosomal protein L18 [Flavobacteriales bacterium]MCB9198226.1 50S ribosomal protein L18 [Flavobacteriales bacterium]
MALTKAQKRIRIKRRVRKVVSGTSERPRLSVFRSNKQIYAQVIDDTKGVTLASASSLNEKGAQGVAKIEQAKIIGKAVAEAAKKAGIEACVFDRNGYLYHGRVKALAEAAREAGLKI